MVQAVQTFRMFSWRHSSRLALPRSSYLLWIPLAICQVAGSGHPHWAERERRGSTSAVCDHWRPPLHLGGKDGVLPSSGSLDYFGRCFRDPEQPELYTHSLNNFNVKNIHAAHITQLILSSVYLLIKATEHVSLTEPLGTFAQGICSLCFCFFVSCLPYFYKQFKAANVSQTAPSRFPHHILYR